MIQSFSTISSQNQSERKAPRVSLNIMYDIWRTMFELYQSLVNSRRSKQKS